MRRMYSEEQIKKMGGGKLYRVNLPSVTIRGSYTTTVGSARFYLSKKPNATTIKEFVEWIKVNFPEGLSGEASGIFVLSGSPERIWIAQTASIAPQYSGSSTWLCYFHCVNAGTYDKYNSTTRVEFDVSTNEIYIEEL